MTLTELKSAQPVGQSIGELDRTLPDGSTDPFCYVKEAVTPKAPQTKLQRVRQLVDKVLRKEPERSFVAISAESSDMGTSVPLVAVGVENFRLRRGRANIDIQPASDTARLDPGLLHGVVELAIEDAGVTTGIVNAGSADVSEAVLGQAFTQIDEGVYEIHAAV